MNRRFHKMHGLGNDFVIFDAREEPLEMDGTRARFIADRRTGVGCDQLILMEPSEAADVRMRIWNSDGGEVEACGNAARCVTLLTGGGTIETKGGIISGTAEGAEAATIDMGEPSFGWEDIPLAYAMDTGAMPVGWEDLQNPLAVNVGNPHIVFFVEDPAIIDLDRRGPEIENDPAFPKRINVHVAAVRDREIHMRSWERGAGLTLACGTGACATAVAAIVTKRADSPVKVHMPGGTVTVSWELGKQLLMRGGTTHVFEGELDLDSLGKCAS
jgi:diaminopimelate epimerase